jgi:hypothetical protein
MSRFRPLLDPWFWVWSLIGAGLAFGMLSFAGLFVGIGCIVLLVLLARDPRTRPGWLGLLVGAGALCLLIAYINREGPGTSCHTFDNGSECAVGLPDPRKWLAAGLVLIGSGLVAHSIRNGRQQLAGRHDRDHG